MKIKANRIVESLERTIKKSQEALINPIQGHSLELLDFSLPYSHLFTDHCRRSLLRKTLNLTPTTIGGAVEYFGLIVTGRHNLIKGGKLIARLVNKLDAKGHIVGCLAPLGGMRLYSESFKGEKYVMFCFVEVSAAGHQMILKTKPKFAIREGQPPTFEVSK